ncbi:MAG: oxidative damage protection protein [Blastocatellia bacterium]
MATIKCTRCEQKLPGLERPPFGGPLGRRVLENICAACWKAWLATQNQLINHYGLSTINAEHQQFLIQNMEAFLFNTGQQAEIDTTLQGKVVH